MTNMRKFYFYFCSLMMLTFIVGCTSEEPVIDSVENEENVENSEAVEDNKGITQEDWELTEDLELSRDETKALGFLEDFSFEVIRESADTQDYDFSVSPISLAIDLAMTANASQGELRSQIINAFKAENLENINSLMEKLMHYLPSDALGACLDISNRIWMSDIYSVPEDKQLFFRNVFNAGVDYVDFKDLKTINKINDWAKEKTRGLIDHILDADKDFSDLDLFIANAVYFKGQWNNKFKEEDTYKETFHGEFFDVQTDMMHITELMRYIEDEKFTLVKIPFKGIGNFYMEVLLPKEGFTGKDVLASLTPEKRKEIYRSSSYGRVHLTFPKFKSRGKVAIDLVLEKLGINTGALVDFTPMGISKPVKTHVDQKTYISVDEEGTELAAVTIHDVSMGGGDPTYKDVVIKVDRPFIYIVRNPDGVVLMAGMINQL